MAYYGGGGGRGNGGWFVPGADGGRGFPWGRGGGGATGVVGSSGHGGGGGERETLAAVMARRAPPPSMIRRDAMRAAEAAAGEVVLRVHPTQEAERRRQDVIGYLKRLVGSSVGCEVFAFGSVPLRTYLPDGDVDITVLGNTWLNSTFINDVRAVLESEQENCDAEFKLTGLHFINAEVKLMKCVIENIVVDVSFNQIGGVSTFCFLELVDRQVGKNHLFKRSIMLIKAWCYHESRILGAHHGLISTYALETLVLYIFNMFHKSLHGPLELSLQQNKTKLLLDKEFVQGFLDQLVVVPNESGGCDTQFRQKFLNIIDPLKGNNNLGRTNFYRIRSAFSFGAQKLGQILMLSPEFTRNEIYGFFANTLKRHGKGERPDIGNSSFQSLLGPENVLSDDGSRLKTSCMNDGENRSDKDLSVTDAHKNSDWTALHADNTTLPPFLLSNMLDLSRDLDLHLGCLRKVQYHLESLFDELLSAVEEACLAGLLDEDSFKIQTMTFKSRSNASNGLSLASSIDSERRKLSPVYCSHSTRDDSQQPHAEAQVDVVWLQSLPLFSNGSALSSSPSTNSDNYPASWFCVSPKSRGTGTYIPKVNYYSYQDRMSFERDIMRERKQRQRVPGRQYYSAEQGYSSSQTEHATAQNQSPKMHTSSQQNGYSSKIPVPSGDLVDLKEHVATDGGTKQAVGNVVENGRQTRPPSSLGIVLPHNGQGNPSVLNSCQTSSPATAEENLEFGSFGPFSLGLVSARFEEAFPALPSRKRVEEVPVPATKGPADEAPAPTPTVLNTDTLLKPKAGRPVASPAAGVDGEPAAAEASGAHAPDGIRSGEREEEEEGNDAVPRLPQLRHSRRGRALPRLHAIEAGSGVPARFLFVVSLHLATKLTRCRSRRHRSATWNGTSPLEWTSTTMAQRQPTVLPENLKLKAMSNGVWMLRSNRNCVREYKDIASIYLQVQSSGMWHVNTEKWGLHSFTNKTKQRKNKAIISFFDSKIKVIVHSSCIHVNAKHISSDHFN
ncbi:uncharacterized protein C2845_PM04G34020 [Panicum miliaceum]|uniref:PAP/OAS1 substrate-binding-related domain-containing protein n=1 Tax=Panicum miliaceum TaxID=4540 RepID=A0A3L6QRK1_PANMI|nr:uncharacterized protein C2845_PM04G34020 [Panicum miliaceum]